MSEFTEQPLGDDTASAQQRIAEALEQRDVLAPALAAFAEELPKGRTRRELTALVESLRSDATSEELAASDEQAARLLPLLSREGSPQPMLLELLDEASRENEGRTQWLRVLLYPLIVLALALAVLVSLCVAIVPAFAEMFDDFNLSLPASTQAIVRLSDFIRRSPVGFALSLVAIAFCAYALYRLFGMLRLPWRLWEGFTRGSSRQVTSMAFFTRRLADALDAGLALPAALELAARTEPRRATRRLATALAQEAAQPGFGLDDSRAARGLPPTVCHALQAGPRRAPSIALLRSLSEVYSSRVSDRCDWSSGFLSQLAIIGVGLIVGFVILALLLPLLSLINSLSG